MELFSLRQLNEGGFGFLLLSEGRKTVQRKWYQSKRSVLCSVFPEDFTKWKEF